MRHLLKVFVIGLAMGLAEVVPGVSAATLAFVTGVYARLVDSLCQLAPGLLVIVKRDGVRIAWTRLDGSFLVALFAGVAVSMTLFGGALTWLWINEPVLTGAFFAGLVMASVWLLFRSLSRFGVDLLLGMAAGAAVGGLATTVMPIDLSPTPLHMFAAGVIAMCAWILPGMSGSLALMLIGVYSSIPVALHRFDLVTLFFFGVGLWFGMVSLAQLLSNLLRRHRDEALAVLAGLMAGALMNLWPWRSTASYQLGANGVRIPVVQEPVWPHVYTSLTGHDPQFVFAVLAAVAGFVLALLIGRLSSESLSDSVQ